MQAVKEKLNDMSAMRKAKADARAEEKAEKEIAKARVEIAHEVRLAREAEAAMDLHVTKAGQKAQNEIAKHTPDLAHDPNANAGGATNAHQGHYQQDDYGTQATATNQYPTYATNTAGPGPGPVAPPTNNS